MFFMAEYANMFAVSAIVSAIFFGGYQSPFGYLGHTLGLPWMVPIEQFFWFVSKGIIFRISTDVAKMDIAKITCRPANGIVLEIFNPYRFC